MTLAFPVPGLPCVLDTDASDVAIGVVLSKVVDGVERPIAFYSRIMNSVQRNYCPTIGEHFQLSLLLCNTFDTTYSAYMSLFAQTITVSNGYVHSNVQKVYLPDGSRRLLSSITKLRIDQVDSTAMLTASRGPSANNAGARTLPLPG